MKLQELKPAAGAKKSRKRVGRGNGSGLGTYSGRGCKGQNSRSGGGVRPGFEGGQSTLIMRMPKLKGFKSPNKVEKQVVNLDKLNQFADKTEITPEFLYEKGLISKKDLPVKILATGELTKKLVFKVGSLSKTAREKIEKVGATIK